MSLYTAESRREEEGEGKEEDWGTTFDERTVISIDTGHCLMSLQYSAQLQASFADKSAARLYRDTSCPDCQMDDALEEDHRSGQIICQRCGVVVEQGFIDGSSEWRSSGDAEKGTGPNRERVAGPANPHLRGGGLGLTMTMTNNNGGSMTGMLARASNEALRKTMEKAEAGVGISFGGRSVKDSDAVLKKDFRLIGDLCDRLNIVSHDRKRAETLLVEARKAGIVKGKKTHAVFAACVYTACRLSDARTSNSRSLKEVIAAAPDGIEKRDVARMYKELRKALNLHQDQLGIMSTDNIIRRFCHNAGVVKEETIAVALALGTKLKELSSTQRVPGSLATASIYIGTFLRRRMRPSQYPRNNS